METDVKTTEGLNRTINEGENAKPTTPAAPTKTPRSYRPTSIAIGLERHLRAWGYNLDPQTCTGKDVRRLRSLADSMMTLLITLPDKIEDGYSCEAYRQMFAQGLAFLQERIARCAAYRDRLRLDGDGSSWRVDSPRQVARKRVLTA